jgi:hypothetical protein
MTAGKLWILEQGIGVGKTEKARDPGPGATVRLTM